METNKALAKRLTATSLYFRVLQDINKNTLLLCGLEANDDLLLKDKIIFAIANNVMRVIPIESSDGKMFISKRDGLMEFKTEFPKLRELYKAILNKNKELLFSIKEMRNKFQHSMHNVVSLSSFSGTDEPLKITFEILIDKKKCLRKICTEELVDLVKEINVLYEHLYIELQKEISIKHYDNAFIRKTFSINLKKLNEVLSLNFHHRKIIGRTMLNL